MLDVAVAYLGSYYPDISQTDVIYQKWEKDKAKRLIKEAKDRKADALRDSEVQKADKDRGKLPQGFEYL